MRKKCPHSEFFWLEFSRIFPYSVRMQENTDQKNFEQEHFLHGAETYLGSFQISVMEQFVAWMKFFQENSQRFIFTGS